ncbi:glycine oxidase ThiO [Arenibaculum pallidiluteum]|uniref:glycine oxidase ThiO n=1 Tax=Arenibaculum pallidiluteum TaxID=2812559 RepID=UPI001B3B798F|nr:glycine oxidase ThiO [Arenibaculum pallidiluteum]
MSFGHLKSSPSRRVAIVGAGAIGLSIGWRLAAAGCSVDIFDRGAAGQGATRAAGGMLAAAAEVEPAEDALVALCRRSQAMWADFAAELEAASGIDVELRREGTLVIALTADDLGKLRRTAELQQRLGIGTRWLPGGEVRRIEPYLSPRVSGALHCPDDHQVENRKVGAALARAYQAAGGRLHEHVAVEGIATTDGRVLGLRIGDGLHEADTVVVAAGAWSRGLGGLPDGLRPPVRPVKGQMLALRMPSGEPLLRHVLWTPGAYLIPRRDGRLLIGATVEERGFDENLTAGGLLSLLESAWRAVPGIEELPVEETWVGFRPGSRDDAPILGPGGIAGLVMATGHHRNGILLTPATAELVARHVLTGEVDPAMAPFGIDRFSRTR